MNATEKLAATYLRLNGFLLLPHFTVFIGPSHNHVDLVGLHPIKGQEVSGRTVFEKDEALFRIIRDTKGFDASQNWIGVVAEVRANKQIDIPDKAHIKYIQNFLGESDIVPICFTDKIEAFDYDGENIIIGLRHVFRWIMDRIEWMNENLEALTKSGSWNLSEEFLSDVLVFHQLGFYQPTSNRDT